MHVRVSQAKVSTFVFVCMFMKHFGCIIYTNLAPLLLYCCLLLVCKDTSCNGGNGAFGGDLANACLNARIDYIVGPSCTDFGSCASATIGSVDSSCNGFLPRVEIFN